MNLYKIANEYSEILSQTFDEETGEINEIAISLLEITKDELNNKGIAVASFIKNIDAERKAIEDAKKNMIERENSLQRRVEWLTSYLQSNMERCGINEIKSPYFAVKLKKCPISVDIQNEDIVPDKYKKVKEVISIDKVKLREEILSGINVPGVQLKQNNRLEIR